MGAVRVIPKGRVRRFPPTSTAGHEREQRGDPPEAPSNQEQTFATFISALEPPLQTTPNAEVRGGPEEDNGRAGARGHPRPPSRYPRDERQKLLALGVVGRTVNNLPQLPDQRFQLLGSTRKPPLILPPELGEGVGVRTLEVVARHAIIPCLWELLGPPHDLLVARPDALDGRCSGLLEA